MVDGSMTLRHPGTGQNVASSLRHCALFALAGGICVALVACGDDSSSTSDGAKDGSTNADATAGPGMDGSIHPDGSAGGVDGAIATDSGAGPLDAGDVDGAGPTSFNFMVLRVGMVDGGALSNASTPAFLEERGSLDGTVLRTIDLPTAASGNSAQLTLSGTGLTEGSLSTSADGRYVTLAGYAADPGIPYIADTGSGSGTKRVVARVDANGTVDTTTQIDNFVSQSVRAATTNDGSGFWVGGSNAYSHPTGVVYIGFGQSAAGTVVSNNVSDTFALAIFGGQLYQATATGPSAGVFQVGNGLPTTTGQTAVMLPGVSGVARGFALLDLDSQVAGADTLYFADSSNPKTTGGVQKWTLDGNNTWAKVATLTDKLVGQGCLQATAAKVGRFVHVICVSEPTFAAEQSLLIRWIDDSINVTPAGTVLASAASGTTFRGVTASPQ